MNEQELKEIWKSVDEEDLPTINFEEIQKDFGSWQSKLQRKIKIDVWSSLSLFAVFISLCFIIPKAVIFLPILTVMLGWGYWEMWKIHKQETKMEDHKSIKDFLEKRKELLTNYIRRTRQILYLIVPLLVISTILVQVTISQFIDIYIRVILLVVFFEIVVIIFSEIYFKIMYVPSIRKAQEMIKELESE